MELATEHSLCKELFKMYNKLFHTISFSKFFNVVYLLYAPLSEMDPTAVQIAKESVAKDYTRKES